MFTAANFKTIFTVLQNAFWFLNTDEEPSQNSKYSLVYIPYNCRTIMTCRNHNAETATNVDTLYSTFMTKKCHWFTVELQMTLGRCEFVFIYN
jgi:hypothetical protein